MFLICLLFFFYFLNTSHHTNICAEVVALLVLVTYIEQGDVVPWAVLHKLNDIFTVFRTNSDSLKLQNYYV